MILAQQDRLADGERQLAREREDNAALRAAVAQLTQRLGEVQVAAAGSAPGDEDGERPRPGGMPGLKPTVSPAQPPRPRKRRARGFGRRRSPPTTHGVQAVARGPIGDVPRLGKTIQRTREVSELGPVPAVVTEHHDGERRGPVCHGRWVTDPALGDAGIGPGRRGSGRLSLIAPRREVGRWPGAAIQWSFATVHRLPLSVGAIGGAAATGAARVGPVGEQLQASIRASPVVHAAETGGREDGANGYVWTFSTPTARDCVHGGRDQGMREAAVGEEWAGGLVRDCSVASTNSAGQHQDCWAHLLRDVHVWTTQHPRDAAGRGWVDAVHDVFARAGAVGAPDTAAGAAELRARAARPGRA